MKEKLIHLYEQNSKHSNYQILASNFEGIIDTAELDIVSRYEKERLEYIVSKIDVKNKVIMDIGGNSGYFTFELSNLDAKQVEYYEGNLAHAEFVDTSVELFDLRSKININKKYYSFNENKKADIIFLLNVVHHLGDDYNCASDINNAKEKMLDDINGLAFNCNLLVFQMGFNWKGNVNTGLFQNGTKREMIDFLSKGLEKNWEIVSIGVAEKDDGTIMYKDLNNKNIERNNELGEFLNRPIFILRSLGVY